MSVELPREIIRLVRDDANAAYTPEIVTKLRKQLNGHDPAEFAEAAFVVNGYINEEKLTKLLSGEREPCPINPGELLSPYVSAGNYNHESLCRAYLVENMIEKGRVYELLGKWKGGKTIVAIDLANHLAHGLPWAGFRTLKCLVIYIAGEAVEDVMIRNEGWRLHQKINDRVPFQIRTIPVSLSNPVEARRLYHEIIELSDQHPGLPILLVIDTLARNIGPGVNENNIEGMGAFANNLIDEVVRPTKATAIVVHHSGHSDSDRGRGHSSFEAAVDGAFKVSMDRSDGAAVITLSTLFSRSTSGESSTSFKVVTQEIPGADNFGNPIEAPVLRYLEDHQPTKRTKGLGRKQEALLELLRTLYAEHQQRIDDGGLNTMARVSKGELRDEAEKRGVEADSSNFYKLVSKLKERSLIYEESGFLYGVDGH
ncbi:MAG: AAA family ATPase [gamma proteobacterium symbiont of Clathrolucina costata]